MAATTLPAAADFTGASVTEGQFKTALTSFHDFVAELQTKAADIASASTTNIGAAQGNYVKITGSTTITAFDNPTAASNVTRICLFAGALTLTHNATSLILPGGANIVTAAGDVAIFVHEGSGNWRCVSYQFGTGLKVTGPVTITGNSLTVAQNGYFNNMVMATSTSDYGYVGYNVNPGGSPSTYTYKISDTASFIKFDNKHIVFYGASSGTAGNALTPTEFGRFDASGNLLTGTDNTQTNGSAAKRWSVVYAGTGTINTSDAREKTVVSPMTADELNAAKQLSKEIGTYQFLAAITEKGTAARHHVGMTVQKAIEVMTANNLDPFKYGFICHDSWEGGDRYAFRMDELLAFIARGFDARLSALEGP